MRGAHRGRVDGVRIDQDGGELPALVRRYLGEPFELDAFAAFAVTEPVLAELSLRFAVSVRCSSRDPFEALVTSITAQQISLRAAFSIRNWLIESFGERHEVAYEFPTRDRLAAARPEEIVAVGFLPAGKRSTSSAWRGRADLDVGLALLPDEEVKSELIALPGLGEWTADWSLARHLGRLDAWPAGDLGLQGRGPFRDDTDVRAAGARFSPFANLAAHYLLVGQVTAGWRTRRHRRGRPLEEVVRRLIEEARAAGADVVEIETTHEDGDARIRAGFIETARALEALLAALEEHLGAHRSLRSAPSTCRPTTSTASSAQCGQFVPRLPRIARSAGAQPQDGWTSAYDEPLTASWRCSAVGHEISDRMGAFVLAIGVEEEGRPLRRARARPRGRRVPVRAGVLRAAAAWRGDRAGSEPAADGPTGADADAVRATARTGRSPEELPAADAMLAELARLFGVPQAAHGYPEAAEREDAIVVPRA